MQSAVTIFKLPHRSIINVYNNILNMIYEIFIAELD